MNNRIIAHIDQNSYFASVEQQARPHLRGKPIAVTGPGKRTIIVAASVEAKKLGIKTGTAVNEAIQICPQITLIKADCTKYESISKNIFDIFSRYTPDIEIFSIDEAFLDLSLVASDLNQAQEIVKKIKSQIKLEIGDTICCSAGIAQNKFMAKLASEAKKPDGLTVVPCGTEIEFLDRFELSDACGIGCATKARLNKLGIFTFKDLRKIDQATLTLIFKSYGLKLYQMARGQDNSKIVPSYLHNPIKSISRSKTLSRNTFDKELVLKMGLFFCRKIAKQLRDHNLQAGTIGIYLRYGDFSSDSWGNKIKNPTCLGENLYYHFCKILEGFKIQKPIRKIGVWVGSLQSDNGQQQLSDEFAKSLNLELACEKINQKYAKDLVVPATLVDMDFQESPSYGFKNNF